MQANQKGFLPVATRVAGVGVMLYAGAIIIFGLQFAARRVISSVPAAHWTAYLPALSVLVMFAVFVYAGYVIAGAFPTLIVSATGLRVRHPLGFSRMFPWADIDRIVEARGIVLNGRGTAWWWPWPLYPYYLYGIFIHYLRPGILISKGTERRAELVAAIQQHLMF